MQRIIASLSLAALTASALGCAALGIGKSPEPIAARVGNEVITVAELDASIKDEANKRGLTTDALLEDEWKKLPPISDDDVKEFYDKNASQMQGAPYEAI